MSTLGWLRIGAEVLLVGGLLVGGLQYLEEREAFARAEAKAEQREEAIDSLRARNDSILEAKLKADSAAFMDSIRLAAARDSLREVRDRAVERTDTALAEADTSAAALEGTLRRLRAKAETVAPPLVPVVDTAQTQLSAHLKADSSVVRGFREQLAAQVELTMQADSMARLNWRRWQRSEAESAGLRDELTEVRKQLKFWKKKAEPGFLAVLGRDTPKLIAAFGAGAAACAAFC